MPSLPTTKTRIEMLIIHNFYTFSDSPFAPRHRDKEKEQAPPGTCSRIQMAEGEGFEPSYPRRGKRFSRPPHSTTLPPLRGGNGILRMPGIYGGELGIRTPDAAQHRIHDFQSCAFDHSAIYPFKSTLV